MGQKGHIMVQKGLTHKQILQLIHTNIQDSHNNWTPDTMGQQKYIHIKIHNVFDSCITPGKTASMRCNVWVCKYLVSLPTLNHIWEEQPITRMILHNISIVGAVFQSWTIGCFTLHLFFELSLVLLTIHAIGLYEVTKKIQRYRQ